MQAYTLASLASDVAAIIDRFGDGKAVVVGHDWGAPVAWTSALLHPGRVRAVAGMSVPYFPPSDISFMDMARQLYAGRFF